jgi:cellulose biosynthesis protein BcsQ
MDSIRRLNLNNLIQNDEFDADVIKRRKKKAPAKVILFGSSKGGTGKTFTCLISAYWYAKKHPTQKVALADFDIIDGQIGITINKLAPTMQDFYKLSKNGYTAFGYLENCKVKTEHFSPNIDFYLAPPQDIPQITNDTPFWNTLFETLISNYDVVFFDSGIDYLGKAPVSQLYKIADKIIITSNPSINSTKSVLKQFKTLSGRRPNNVFKASDDILSRTNVVLTRMYDEGPINDIVINNIEIFAPVIAKFGNIDSIISEVQWYQHWYLIDQHPEIYNELEKIIEIADEEED